MITTQSFEKHFTNIEKEKKAIRKDLINSKKKYDLLKILIKKDKTIMAEEYLVNFLSDTDKIKYAIYASKSVLKNFKKYYPNDDKLKTTVEYMEEYLNNPTKEIVDKIEKIISKTIIYSEIKAEDDYSDDTIDTDSPIHAIRVIKKAASLVCEHFKKEETDISKYIYYINSDAGFGSENEKMEKKVLEYGLELLKKSES
jgi:hypothetical protein